MPRVDRKNPLKRKVKVPKLTPLEQEAVRFLDEHWPNRSNDRVVYGVDLGVPVIARLLRKQRIAIAKMLEEMWQFHGRSTIGASMIADAQNLLEREEI